MFGIFAMWTLGDEKSTAHDDSLGTLWLFILVSYLFAAVTFINQQWMLAARRNRDMPPLRPMELIPVICGHIWVVLLIAAFEYWIRARVVASYASMLGPGAELPALTHFIFLLIPKMALSSVGFVLAVASIWGLARHGHWKDHRILRWIPFLAFTVFGLLFLLVMPFALVLPLLNI